MQRRTFLQNGAAGLLTAAGSASAADSPKIRTAFFGTGHSHFSGKLKAIQDNPAFEVAGVVENDPALRARLKSDPRTSALRVLDEKEMLQDKSIQLAVVECRAWEALPWGAKVIAAGKHLHVEKPPGNDYAAFRELVEQARRRKLLVQTGYLFRWHPAVSAAIEAAEKGWLGEVFLIRASINSDRGPEERAIEGHFKGGGLFELAGHFIDRIVELKGRPTAVKSWLRHDTSVADKLADNNLAVLEYPKCLAVVMQATQVPGAGPQRCLEVVGSGGTFLVYPETNPATMHVVMRQAQGPYKAGAQVVSVPNPPRFVPDFAELARAIQTNSPLKHSYDHELLLQETLLRASGELG